MYSIYYRVSGQNLLVAVVIAATIAAIARADRWAGR